MNSTLIIPLLFQLLSAYQPRITPRLSIATPTPSAIVSLNTNTVPLPTVIKPKNIGGIGNNTTIALIGDSMIESLEPELPQLRKSLSAYYPDYPFNLININYPAQNIEYAQKKLNEDLISLSPDIVIIESFAYNNFGNNQEGINRHWLDLDVITTTINKSLPNTKIILAAAIPPNSITFANGTDNKYSSLEKIEKTKTIKLYIQNLINFATSKKIPLANAYHYCLDSNNEGLLECINPSNNIYFSNYGAQIFCDTISKTIFDNKML